MKPTTTLTGNEDLYMNEYLDRFIRFMLAVEKLEKAVQRTKNICMAEFGLRGGHVMCLCQLLKHPAGLTAAELARQCEVDRAFISRTVAELTDAECICLKPVGSGRRTSLVLTERGEQLANRIKGIVDDAVRIATDGIEANALESFYDVMGRIEKNLTVANDEVFPMDGTSAE